MPERERITSLLFSRRNAGVGYGEPTAADLAGVRNSLADLSKTQITDILTTSPEIYNSGMSQLKARIIFEEGRVPTRADVVATSLKEPLLNYLLEQAAEADMAGDKRKFVARFDVFFGAGLVFDRLMLGIGQNEGDLSDEEKTDILVSTAEMYDEHGAAISIADSADAYVKLNSLASRMGQLFHDDPTGSSIVVDCISDIVQYFPGHPNQAMHEFQIKEFVLAGAEFAKKFYQAIYQMPERIERRVPVRERQLSKKDEEFFLDLLSGLESSFVSRPMLDPAAEGERIGELERTLIQHGMEESISPIHLTVVGITSDLSQRLQYESDQLLGVNNRIVAYKQFLSSAAKGVVEAMARVGVADGRKRFGVNFGGFEIRNLDGSSQSYSVGVEELQKMDELLSDDPTGFSLLDWHVNRVRGSVAEMKGARMAANIYRAIYPVAAQYLADK